VGWLGVKGGKRKKTQTKKRKKRKSEKRTGREKRRKRGQKEEKTEREDQKASCWPEFGGGGEVPGISLVAADGLRRTGCRSGPPYLLPLTWRGRIKRALNNKKRKRRLFRNKILIRVETEAPGGEGNKGNLFGLFSAKPATGDHGRTVNPMHSWR